MFFTADKQWVSSSNLYYFLFSYTNIVLDLWFMMRFISRSIFLSSIPLLLLAYCHERLEFCIENWVIGIGNSLPLPLLPRPPSLPSCPPTSIYYEKSVIATIYRMPTIYQKLYRKYVFNSPFNLERSCKLHCVVEVIESCTSSKATEL